MPLPEHRLRPSQEFRFFLHDPVGDGFMFFRTAEDRDKAAPHIIGEYCDDYWSEEVTEVCAGEVTHVATKTNVKQRPKREDFENEDEFDDADSEFNSGHDETCDYELRPVPQS